MGLTLLPGNEMWSQKHWLNFSMWSELSWKAFWADLTLQFFLLWTAVKAGSWKLQTIIMQDNGRDRRMTKCQREGNESPTVEGWEDYWSCLCSAWRRWLTPWQQGSRHRQRCQQSTSSTQVLSHRDQTCTMMVQGRCPLARWAAATAESGCT